MKIPYALTPAVTLPRRYEHMKSSIARNVPRLRRVPIDESKTLSVACYGPSLKDTWRDLRHPIISMSGATRWLAERGVIADWHLDMDPRESKVRNLDPPIVGVHYLMASVCCPRFFDVLVGQRVTLWHAVSSSERADLQWVAEHDHGQEVVSTGSTVGLAAIQVGGLLGYRHFEIHGMDGSFADDGARHAAAHYGPRQRSDITWAAGGVTYRTSQIMANAVAETVNAMRVYPIFCVFHGRGLTQALVDEERLPNACVASNAERASFVRASRPTFVDHPPVPRGAIKSTSAWEAICFHDPDPRWLEELQEAYALAESRRHLAKFNTGSIGLETGLLLRATCAWRRPKVVVEVGTFIGKSTAALMADRIYTCDKDNDCVPCSDAVRTHPYTTATQMMRGLVDAGEQVDLFFFDGRLVDEDVPLVMKLSTSKTVYAFDDYNVGGKGLANVTRLAPLLPQHGFVEPHKDFAGRSTLAMLVPMSASVAS